MDKMNVMKRLRLTMALGMMMSAGVVCAQGVKTVKGNITDQNGEPIIGATVQATGQTKTGAVSDIDGNFTLDNVQPGQEITITYVGFVPKKVKYNGTNLTITLQEDKKVLDEVIVTGYGAVSRKNLTTSIAKVKGDDVIKTGTTNMGQMLMGRAAGLQATVASAQPGGGISMTVRGGGTPLYVVDGIVMPTSSLEGNSGGQTTRLPNSVNRSGLAGLNPDDIESIEVLKDASAAIYGINAANGVILITTKSGKKGKMKVTYDGSYSSVHNYKYIQSLDAKEFMNYSNIFKREQYLYNHQMGVYGSTAFDGTNTDNFSQDQIAQAQTTNWRDKILRSGYISAHNVTIQGGADRINYYLSGNYYRQQGTVANSTYERFILRANVSAQIAKFLKLTTSINYNKNQNGNGTVGGTTSGRGPQALGSLSAALALPPYLPIRDDAGKYTAYQMLPNPVGMLDIQDRSYTDGLDVNLSLDIDIIPNMLRGRLLYGYNREDGERQMFIPSNVYFDQMFKSRGSIQNYKRDNSTMEATLSFDHTFFNNALSFNAVVGMGRYLNHSHGLGVSYNEINDALANDNISAATGVMSPTSYRTSDEKRSQFGRMSFDFLDRYVLSGTLRRDGTDKFFKDKKYSWFPSVSAAWKIYNEKFMKDVKWVNMLKLRASYGVTGNDNLGATLYGAYAPFGTYVKFNHNATTYVPIYLKSKDYPDVTWEKTKMKNIGLDFSIFNDRINGSFDYFVNDITDMLGTANTEGMSMFATRPINGGHIRRYGWDATINTVNIQKADFRWTSMLTLSHYNSIWKERFPNYDYKVYQQRDDEPVNALYFYRTAGIINSEKSNMPASQPEVYQQPGCPIIKDLNGDGKIDEEDIDMVNVVPTLYWGLGNTFYYKNWDLNIFIYSQLGLKKYNYALDWADPRELASQSTNQSTLIHDVYNSETNPNGSLPGMAFFMASASLPSGVGTDINYKNASFVRVRNITLGYTFDAHTLGRLANYIGSIRLYVDCQNPFTFTSFDTFDPEVITGGNYKGGKAEYPMTRTYSAGVKIQF